MKTAIRTLFGKFAGLSLLMAFFALPALSGSSAEMKLLKSRPEAGSTVLEVYQVHLWFNQALSRNLSQMWIFPDQEMQLPLEERTSLVRGVPFLDYRNSLHLTAEVLPLPPGHYWVVWQVTAANESSGLGQYDFYVPESPVRSAIDLKPSAHTVGGR